LASECLPANNIDNIGVDQHGDLYGNATELMTKVGCNTAVFMIPKNQDGCEMKVSFLLSATAAGRGIQSTAIRWQ